MSGDHNMHQKPRSYLDDFECPRCGHCCKTDLARVGEVGVWGEWVGLTDEERHGIREWQRIQEELGPVWAPMMLYLYEAIEAKLKEKNHG
jgi:hypothetical protein